MTLRTGHGRGRGVPRVEVLPPDELPRGVPAEASTPEQPGERTRGGHFAPGSRTAQRKGALAAAAKKRTCKILRGLGLLQATPEALRPFVEQAEEFVAHEVERLAKTVGGGVCGAAPASMVQSAGLQLVASRYAFGTGDMSLSSKLANDSRQNLLAAHELCAREARARAETDEAAPVTWLPSLTQKTPDDAA